MSLPNKRDDTVERPAPPVKPDKPITKEVESERSDAACDIER